MRWQSNGRRKPLDRDAKPWRRGSPEPSPGRAAKGTGCETQKALSVSSTMGGPACKEGHHCPLNWLAMAERCMRSRPHWRSSHESLVRSPVSRSRPDRLVDCRLCRAADTRRRTLTKEIWIGRSCSEPRRVCWIAGDRRHHRAAPALNGDRDPAAPAWSYRTQRHFPPANPNAAGQ